MNPFRHRLDPHREPREVPQKGAALFFYLLHTYARELFSVNLLMLLCSLPLVTLPAAVCAGNRICQQYLQKGYCMLLPEYWKEFKQSFFRSLAAGLLMALFLASGFISICYGLAHPDSGYRTLCIGFGLVEMGIATLIGSWCFLLIPVQNIPFRLLLSNAVAMMLLEPGCDMRMLTAAAAVWAVGCLLFPISLVFLLMMPVVLQFTLCWFSMDALQRRIITPGQKSDGTAS